MRDCGQCAGGASGCLARAQLELGFTSTAHVMHMHTCTLERGAVRGKRKVTTTQFPRRLSKEKVEVRQSHGSVPPFPHRV
jgi:hypothetical protein